MPAKSPKTRPRITAQDVEEIARKHGVKDSVAIVGIRGYYLRTLGNPKKNDRGIWDDCIAVISPTAFAAYNGNTDPSFWRKGIASLVEGVHQYRKGKHGISRGNPYPALRPANPSESLPVTRDGQLGRSQGVAINIHRGGSINSTSASVTSSLGCQTIPKEQWPSFVNLVYGEMDRYHQKTVPYVLTSAQSA
jgi:lysozyme